MFDKAEEYNDSRVILCTEEFTSKTCPHCGHVNKDVNRDTFLCESNGDCPIRQNPVHRDVNGARNILRKRTLENWQMLKKAKSEDAQSILKTIQAFVE